MYNFASHTKQCNAFKGDFFRQLFSLHFLSLSCNLPVRTTTPSSVFSGQATEADLHINFQDRHCVSPSLFNVSAIIQLYMTEAYILFAQFRNLGLSICNHIAACDSNPSRRSSVPHSNESDRWALESLTCDCSYHCAKM